MTKQGFMWWSVPLFLLVLAATIFVYPDLPATIPTHWDAAGQVNGHGPRATVFLEPLIMGLMILLWPGLPRVSPDRYRVEGFSGSWWFSGLVTVGLLAYVQCILLAVLRDGSLDIGRALFGGIGVAIVLLGNVLGKVKRNFWLGVRTPWTLASDRVWYATHRLAGKSMVAGGLVVVLSALLGLPGYVATAALLAGALAPVVFSLVYYKRLERTGGA
ncbi:SdpI family protein [Massilia aerilata]|uniref:SdpI family protein n=1 Tax=Massilia aerilata TaxID=453817 RepID=A0ABW0RWI7_9BURK